MSDYRVTPEIVASVRALITGDSAEFERAGEAFDLARRSARGALLSAAFFSAAERRFLETGTAAEVVDFVAALRARYGLIEDVQPRTAERLLLAAFTDEDIDDIGGHERGSLFPVLLTALVKDADYSDDELDDLLEDSRRLADRWLANAG